MGHVGVQVLRGQAGYAMVLVRVPLKGKEQTRVSLPQPHNAPSFDFLTLAAPDNFSNIVIEILFKST